MVLFAKIAALTMAGLLKSVYCISDQPIEEGDKNAEVAVLAVHGLGGGMGDAAGDLRAALRTRGENEAVKVYSPLFPHSATHGKEARDGRAFWSADWRGGADADGIEMSSFDVIDAMIEKLSDRTLFPKLKRVVLAGFSAGGQFVGRYVAVGKCPARDDLLVEFAVIGPSTEFRFDQERWLYGLKDRPRYPALTTDEGILTNVTSRFVWRGVGEKDVGSGALDVSPEARKQGANRKERQHAFYDLLERKFPAWARQTTIYDMPGLGHEGRVWGDREFVNFIVKRARLLILSSRKTSSDPEWAEVSRTLAAKHVWDARTICETFDGSVTSAREIIRTVRPTHVAFVMRPEEIDFPTVIAVKRMMREIDDDPFDDAIWGFVTGPRAQDALRIAMSTEPKELRAMLSTTGVDDAVVPGPLYCLSDAYPEGCWRVKSEAGEVSHFSSSNDVSHVFAEGWNTLDPEIILTASHASQRNLEMPFSRGNIVPLKGRFAMCPDLKLIDYRTGQAKVGAIEESKIVFLNEPKREKVWLAAGNCLIADNLRPGENMVMTALGFGKVNQFVGYAATTWYGEVGWGTWKNMREGMSLVEAYFAANRTLIEEIEATVENARDFKPEFKNAREYDKMLPAARAFAFRVKKDATAEMKKNLMGRLWDRDATVFYGDPLQHVRLR